MEEITLPITTVSDTQIAQIANDKLREAIKRVLEKGGAAGMSAEGAVRYDRQHHRHNKS